METRVRAKSTSMVYDGASWRTTVWGDYVPEITADLEWEEADLLCEIIKEATHRCKDMHKIATLAHIWNQLTNAIEDAFIETNKKNAEVEEEVRRAKETDKNNEEEDAKRIKEGTREEGE